MMLKRFALAAVAAALGGALMAAPAMAQGGDVLTGDTRLACEAILCLASAARPDECKPSLARYFSISFRRLSDTLRGRIDFLNLCPAARQDSNMQKLINAIATGAGRCDASSLNASLQAWSGSVDNGALVISNQMPDHCPAYTTNSHTDLGATSPVYVGTPERGGHWVDQAQYQQALAEYNARIAAQDAPRQGE